MPNSQTQELIKQTNLHLAILEESIKRLIRAAKQTKLTKIKDKELQEAIEYEKEWMLERMGNSIGNIKSDIKSVLSYLEK